MSSKSGLFGRHLGRSAIDYLLVFKQFRTYDAIVIGIGLADKLPGGR